MNLQKHYALQTIKNILNGYNGITAVELDKDGDIEVKGTTSNPIAVISLNNRVVVGSLTFLSKNDKDQVLTLARTVLAA